MRSSCRRRSIRRRRRMRLPERSAVPVRRHDPGPVEAVPAAGRLRLGHRPGRQVGRPRQHRRVLREAEHAEPGRLGDDQRHPAEERLPRYDVYRLRRHAGVAEPARAERRCRRARSRSSPVSECSIATTRIRASTASTPDSSASWRRASPAYADFTYAKGDAPDAVPQLQRPRHRRRAHPAADPRHDDLHRRQPVRARIWATCS